MRAFLRATLQYALGMFGFRLSRIRSSVLPNSRSSELLYSRVYPEASYSPWLSDLAFLSTYHYIKSNTLVDQYRCYELWDMAKQSAMLKGAILEVGVWRGGTGCLLAKAAPKKTVYLADTFTGVVKAGKNDTGYAGGEHADTSEEIVRDLLNGANVTNAALIKGIFPDETGAAVPGNISLLHIDVDTYESGKDVVLWSLPRLSIGSFIVFDDYGFFACAGIARLVQDLRSSLSGFAFVHNLNGHAILIKVK
jgi:O-methyltransferase